MRLLACVCLSDLSKARVWVLACSFMSFTCWTSVLALSFFPCLISFSSLHCDCLCVLLWPKQSQWVNACMLFPVKDNWTDTPKIRNLVLYEKNEGRGNTNKEELKKRKTKRCVDEIFHSNKRDLCFALKNNKNDLFNVLADVAAKKPGGTKGSRERASTWIVLCPCGIVCFSSKEENKWALDTRKAFLPSLFLCHAPSAS